jgi:hypothetical protein
MAAQTGVRRRNSARQEPPAMAKTKFFRIATEGATIDGRTVDRATIEQCAATYNPATYTARINIEHLRGYSPEPPFNAYGSIAELKAEEVTIDVAGKQEKRMALFAALDVNDQAKAINQAGQKLFSSIEVIPDFAKSGKAYVAGMALTDSPAMLGTEVLKFSRDEKRKDHIAVIEEVVLEFEDAAADEVTGAFSSMKKFFDSLINPKVESPPVVTSQPVPIDKTADQSAQFATAMRGGMEELSKAFTAASLATSVQIGKVAEDLAAFKAEIEKKPNGSYTARPKATGGGERVRADC